MKIAIVGSGVSGLSAAWLLNEYSDHEIEIFEANDYIGGHTNTQTFTDPSNPKSGKSVRVDTGFIVFNPVTYPNLLRFLSPKYKNIQTIASDMSFSVSRNRGLYEWAGINAATLFAQRRNLVNPKQWRMIWDILRFNASCTDLLAADEDVSIGDYLRRNGYSKSFQDNYLLPMTAAIWSTPPNKCALDFPAKTLIRFMHNHHLAQAIGQPQWLTIKGGSDTYIHSITSIIAPSHIHLSTPVTSISTSPDSKKVVLRTLYGKTSQFDHVIMACHADQSLEILENGKSGATKEEKRILGAFKFSKNVAVLHADTNMMPVRRQTWSAWNYLTKSQGNQANIDVVSLTYWMNLLQAIPEKEYGPVLVTLNPPSKPRPELTVGRWEYEHPLYTSESVKAQSELHKIQNTRGITYCGAWTKYGFHEDGFTSGMKVAVDHLGVTPPFPIATPDRPIQATLLDTFLKLIIEFLESLRRLMAHYFYPIFAHLAIIILSVMDTSLLPVAAVLPTEISENLQAVRRIIRSVREFYQ